MQDAQNEPGGESRQFPIDTPPTRPLPPAPPPPPRRNVKEWLLTILTLGLLAAVTVMQRPEAPDMEKVKEARTGKVVEPVTINPLVGFGKALLWFKGELHNQPVGSGAAPPTDAAEFIPLMDDFARSGADRFRLAILAGDLKDSAERERRFAELEEKLDPESPLHEDIKTVRALTSGGATEPPSAEAKQDLRKRHGWFAELLLAGETPGGEALFEQQVARDGQWLVLVLVLFGLGILTALVAGLVLLIIFIVKWASGTMPARFERTPVSQGSDRALWLETFAVFLASFLLIHFVGEAIAGPGGKREKWALAAVLLMQWSLVAVVFWPRLRGMSWERFTQEIGWHRGRGVMKEIGAGVMGYLAGLPLYFAMAIFVTLVSLLVEMLRKAAAGGGGEEMPLPDNKVFEMLEGASGWVLFLLGTLIVVWAPLVEESIFRGALYRHVRQRLGGGFGMVASVLLVAAAFAAAHAYVLAGIIMVATLGGIFAVMREQRGSLIAPMTAHCLHNSMVMAVVLAIVPVMRG